MMKRVDVLYFVEHVAREFDVACLVKYYCQKHYNLSVQIASLYFDVKRVIRRIKPQIIVVPYFYSKQDSGIKTIFDHWRGVTWLNLCFEQILSPTNKDSKAPKDEFARQQVYYYAWGDFFRNYLIDHGVSEKKIFTGGNPSFKLYRQPYKNIYPKRNALARKFNLNTDKRWIFFPMNYGWAFLSDARIEISIKQGVRRDIANKNRDFNRRSLYKVLKWWISAARQLENVEFIVRPRPAIPQQVYIDKLLEQTNEIPHNLHIIKDGSVREWILSSDIVMSSFSTSLLEAALIEKPIYMLEPYPFPEWLHCDWFDTIKHLSTEQEFIKVCSEPLDMSTFKSAHEYIHHNIVKEGSITGIARILYHLKQKEKGNPEYILSLSKSLSEYFCGFMFIQNPQIRKVAKFILAKLGLYTMPEGSSVIDHYEKDRFSPRDVYKRISKWRKVIE